MPKKKKKPSPPPPFNGDHGTGTSAAIAGTYLEEVKNEKDENPNRMARRRRKSAIDALSSLTMRQKQAAKKIEEAWCRVEMLGSGSPLRDKIDASPKPDAVVASQIKARKEWLRVTDALLDSERKIVYHVCCENRPLTELHRRHGIQRAKSRFEEAMDRTADWLGY